MVMTVDDIMYYSMLDEQRVIVYRLDDDETLFDGYMDEDEYDSVRDCEISTWDITTDNAICFNI